METPLRERYTCKPICRIVATLLWPAGVIGPAGDELQVPLQITGGRVAGLGADKQILFGVDFATMRSDEKLLHNGSCVIADPHGNILVSYDGTSQGEEGAYDDVLEGRCALRIPSRLSVRMTSTNPDWRWLDQWPLLGIGWFDGGAGTFDFTLLALNEHTTEN